MDFKEKIVALFNKYGIELSPKQGYSFKTERGSSFV